MLGGSDEMMLAVSKSVLHWICFQRNLGLEGFRLAQSGKDLGHML